MNQGFATKSMLFEAIELINSGRIGEAERLCRAAVELNENDVNMTALLGRELNADQAFRTLLQAEPRV